MPIGSTASSFLRYTFSIPKDILSFSPFQPNTIVLRFKSAEREAEHLAASLPFPLPTQFGNGTIKRHWNLVRKPACQAGWDWGIALMACGILGDVSLVAAEGQGAEIDYITVQQHWAKLNAELDTDDVDLTEVELEITAHVRIIGSLLAGASLEVELSPAYFSSDQLQREDLKCTISQIIVPPGQSTTIKAAIEVRNPRLWFPNGLGGQPLYRLQATLKSTQGAVLATNSINLGLRSLRVVNKHDELGASFYFVVNNIPIFAKGANWIPCDPLPSGMTKEKYEDRLRSAAAVGMNMIRIWGGGMWENEAFYDSCDALGLLIYHDLPFSCSTYPSSKEFLDLVVPEVRHNVRKLQHRPSIALWCGDNEGIGALTWFPETTSNRDLYTTNYDRLSRKLAETIEEEDPGRLFWPSSPCGGPSLTDVWKDNWHADGFGDMHFWSVWHESKPFEAYWEVNPRFCSEFGFQSFPSISTINRFCPPEEQNPYSEIMEYHQKNSGGNQRIMSTMSLYFRFPDQGGLRSIIYLSQLQQALAMKTAIEYWRTLRPTCMGALYWQLNDMWGVASWSSLESSGRWKMLHYFARSFYANVAVFALPGKRTKRGRSQLAGKEDAEETVEIWVVNDWKEPVAISLNLELWDLPNSKHMDTLTLARTVPGLSAEMLARYPVSQFCPDAQAKRSRFLHLTLAHSLQMASPKDGKSPRSTNNYFFVPYKHLVLAKPDPIGPQVTTGEGSAFHVKISSRVVLLHAYLSVDDVDGEFEGENGICAVLPGREAEFRFIPRRRLSLDEFKDRLAVQHLRDTFV